MVDSLLDRADRFRARGEQYGARIIQERDVIDWSRYGLSEEDQARVRDASTWRDALIQEFAIQDAELGATMPWDGMAGRVYMRPGELSVWSGYSGHGKSLMLSQVFLGLVGQQHKCCIASLEMRPIQTLKRMVRQYCRTDSPGPSDVRSFSERVSGRLWLYDQVGTVKQDRVMALCRYSREEIGAEHVLIDSLMKCGIAPDDYTRQKKFTDDLSTYAKDSGTHIHLVAHSRKRDSEELQGKMDVKGTSELTDMADNVFIVWANRRKQYQIQEGKMERENEPDAILVCDKQRNGEWQGRLSLWFSPVWQTFSDVR